MYSIFTLALLTTPIHAATSARVWTHFYPSCPGDPFSDLSSFEDYEETAPPQDIAAGVCTNVNVPSYQHNLVSAISVDAELLSGEHSKYFSPSRANCNITVHEVPECIDPPLITKKVRNGVEVSQCEDRKFAAWNEVWLQLVCDSTGETQGQDIPRIEHTNNVQAAQSMREPEQEARVENAGHWESEQVVQSIMRKLAEKHSHFVSGKHHNATKSLNGSHHNATVSGRPISRRKLSVLRNRDRLY